MKSITIYHLPFTILAILIAMCFTGCEPNTPNYPIQDSYPKKHLIEEFTGQACGYCPYGMDCVHAFMEDDPDYVLVMHHAGYMKDHFTVTGSSTLCRLLEVEGAPSVTIDRTKTNYGSGKAVVFHPGDLKNTNKAQFDTTTYASVRISNSYKAGSRELKIKVYGEIADPWAEDLYLTVLVKESGMVDYQQDFYNNGGNGWKEFRHTNAVRAFLTAAKGDAMTIKDRRYQQTYTLTLDDDWVAENCMVVAFISENLQPIVQVEQQPVVSGTTGGDDIQHGGITPYSASKAPEKSTDL